jgi:CheY-like chemotaxis protein
VRRLRSEQQTWELPVLVLGGERDEAFAAGANAHLPIPFEPRELVERAAELVQLV